MLPLLKKLRKQFKQRWGHLPDGDIDPVGKPLSGKSAKGQGNVAGDEHYKSDGLSIFDLTSTKKGILAR